MQLIKYKTNKEFKLKFLKKNKNVYQKYFNN